MQKMWKTLIPHKEEEVLKLRLRKIQKDETLQLDEKVILSKNYLKD
jgi:hypothetical protein